MLFIKPGLWILHKPGLHKTATGHHQALRDLCAHGAGAFQAYKNCCLMFAQYSRYFIVEPVLQTQRAPGFGTGNNGRYIFSKKYIRRVGFIKNEDESMLMKFCRELVQYAK